ncbi:MAG: NAD(P)/FAD-dependent oxidoreductase [Pseudotabrizicola sp.]|uniref:FAD-dependent oxidoreductase n=1 Tax=Pseudotabrizicola sp. TaxID=2939647 RepID=UPI00272F75C4|nr:NAD(P)/FAD-dependent oxidoreductase [Pseudotabrizicola sp.]MDP2080680.1 NAD(P)/FAD-dependent oxidoreductase [Pseudotabrizicola sp.]MDZ7574734.1 NAD(P)/FAD-dependent oxidoreductase [Pseudotabrizicola sp.]
MRSTIAIIGAGVGGLASAALAQDAGHSVTLFERFDNPRPLGSGLVIQPVGLAVLDAIGAGASARQMGQPIHHMLGHEVSGREVLNVAYRPSAPGLALHRSALFQALWDQCVARGVPVITSATVQAAPQLADKREVTLTDGRRFGPFDLVVDTSGATSRLSPLKSRALPFGAVWGTVPWPDGTDFAPDQLRQRYAAARTMVGVLPLGQRPGLPGRHAAIFWSLPVTALDHWPQTDMAAWRNQATTLWPEMAPFLSPLTQSTDTTPARYTHGTLRRPYAQAMAFVGDSAHRASPQLGQGANMALLDAMALVVALDTDTPLPAYAAMRRWHVRTYQAMSAVFTPMYQSDSRSLPLLRDYLLAPLAPLPGVRRLLTRLVSGDMLPPLAGQAFPKP